MSGVTLKEFKKAYANAAGKDQFEINGFQFVTGYAKYLIEYLEDISFQRGLKDEEFVVDFTREGGYGR